ncbi:hypothetical protein [Flavobacterium taihuense]|uniref:Uncharacterized protein n=1 Tax=Flavobacterium taihuense TaxID=2857508 RepID=A0ABS6Y1L7_9FLAO|nr:hypothetical protein [Flavobacterium taihuense]MBW4362401.1 hypothetical protein [Flavobacterium taihuense]
MKIKKPLVYTNGSCFLALMRMESLDGINQFFLVLQERPTEAPCGTVEKTIYDGELVMDSRKQLRPKTNLFQIEINISF